MWGGMEELVVALFLGRMGALLYEIDPLAFIMPPTGIPNESEASLPDVKSTRCARSGGRRPGLGVGLGLVLVGVGGPDSKTQSESCDTGRGPVTSERGRLVISGVAPM